MTLSKTIANPYRILAGDRWSYQTRNPKPLTLNPKLQKLSSLLSPSFNGAGGFRFGVLGLTEHHVGFRGLEGLSGLGV